MNRNFGILLLRVGLAFAFFYAAISGFLEPEQWIGWLPEFVRNETTLIVFGVVELVMGFWLLSGLKTFWAAGISGFMLLGIVVFNLGAMLIVFRDVSLALAAFALAAISKNEQQ